MKKLTAFAIIALLVSAGPAWAPTKIAPAESEPPHPFTIIDTPEKRLVDGSVAVFRLNGAETVLPLRTHKPFNTAQGQLAADMLGGVYEVSVRRPDGSEIEIGFFTVFGATEPPPSILPDIGAVGDPFTITDPLARMMTEDLAVFYAEGTDPALAGTPADNTDVNPDGTTLTGNVPGGAAQGVQNFVSVRPSLAEPSLFGDLGFFVTAPPEPFIEPTSGPETSTFTITDPDGRLGSADRIIISPEGQSPDQGTPALFQTFVDGTTVMGVVPPGLVPGLYFVTIHAGDPSINPPLINALAFEVTAI